MLNRAHNAMKGLVVQFSIQRLFQCLVCLFYDALLREVF